jgi:hypothetical protein
VIKERCFSYCCGSVREVIFETESRLQRIEKRAFYGTGRTAITIPSSVEEIRKQGFDLCKSLSEVAFEPKSKLKRIGDSAFSRTALKKVIIPSSVEVVGKFCFESCESLREISFEKNSELKEIGKWAFGGTKIEKFEIPLKCEVLSGLSLEDVKSVSVSKENPFFIVEDDMLMSSDRKRLIRYFGSEARIVVKKEVEVIEERCFGRYSTLHVVIFEEDSGLKEIRPWAFIDTSVDKLEIPSKCQILNGLSLEDVKSVTVSKENPFLIVEDSFLKSYDRKRLIQYMGSEERVVVKKEVEVIGEGCFYDCKYLREVEFQKDSKLQRLENRSFSWVGLTKVVIPASVEAIGEGCFWECSLCEVIFERGSKLRRLEKSSFADTHLREIIIPASVEVIGEECFFWCRSLSRVTYEGHVADVAESAFDGCSSKLKIQ